MKTSLLRTAIAALCFVGLAAFPSISTAAIVVSGQSNIFGAGHVTAPAPGGFGGGQFPVLFEFTGTPTHSFGVTGQVTYDGTSFYGADGGQFLGSATDIDSF